MIIYKTNGEAKFEIDNVESEETEEKVKVKITHVMPNMADVNIFSGDSSVKYPFIIGHSAIGVVSDDRPEYGLKRGTKIILNPYKINSDGTVSTMGVDESGFMRELIFIDKDNIIPFPEDVDEEQAIFAEKVSIALKALNSNKFEKGDYVVIVGSDSLCNIIGQLALYFQLVPIMIGNNEDELTRAERCGIYYTVNATKESPIEKIREITCDRMAETVIFEITPEASSAFAFPMSKSGGNCVLLSENNVVKNFDADIAIVCKKNLNLRGISVGDTEFESAINILAQNILKFDGFIEKRVEKKDAEILLRELRDEPGRYFNAVIVF